MKQYEKIPKYVELARILQERIGSGDLRPGDRVPSYVELRNQYGASQGIAERVYSLLEQDGLIVRAQGRGTFVAEPRVTRTGLIGFIGDHFNYASSVPYAAQLVSGIQSVASEREKQIVLLDRDSTQGLEKVEGVLISSSLLTEPLIRKLPPTLPRVSLLADIEGTPSVVPDDYGAARLAVEHLAALGHRRIGFLIENAGAALQARICGYRDALGDLDIPFDSQLLRHPEFSCSANMSYTPWARRAMTEWLEDGWSDLGCTAIVAQNDYAGVGLLNVLQEAGVRVPRDVSVISFDGTDICDCASPPLSAIEFPLQQIGRTGMQLLLSCIEKDDQLQDKITLPVTLRERSSTGVANSH